MSSRTVFAVALVFALAILAAMPLYGSGVRIVRLSYASGDVRLARSADAKPEAAILNTPIVEGSRLVAGEDGLAEIEFENGSVVRVAGPAEISFDHLGVNADNGHVNGIVVVRGTVYAHVKPQKHDEYSFTVSGNQTLVLEHSAHLRIQAGEQAASVAVMDGEAELRSGGNAQSIRKSESLTVARGGEVQPLARNIAPGHFDAWDAKRDHTHEAELARLQRDPYGSAYQGYGAAELGNYGAYTFIPGFGAMWRPFGFGMDWSPFSYGAWGMYPGFGWTYISAYPWGWAPYRYGGWYWFNDYGWMWGPGNYSLASWSAVPVISSKPPGFASLHAPVSTTTTTLLVGNPPLAVRGAGSIQMMPRSEQNAMAGPRGAHTQPIGGSGQAGSTGSMQTSTPSHTSTGMSTGGGHTSHK